jgi:hypothetical protein
MKVTIGRTQAEFVLLDLLDVLHLGDLDDFLDLVDATAFFAFFAFELRKPCFSQTFLGDFELDGLVGIGKDLQRDEISNDLETGAGPSSQPSP